jgi:hypothetical protein
MLGDRIEMIYAIDPYVNNVPASPFGIDMPLLYEQVSALLLPHKDRVTLIRSTSDEAALTLSQKVHLVFVDGDHSEFQCHRDIVLYEPLIVSGGIMMGHDYGGRATPGVAQAVDRYALRANRSLVVPGIDMCWYWRVP